MPLPPPRMSSCFRGPPLALALACLAAGAAGSPARATSLVRMDEASLARGADWIVRGTVLSSESAYREGAVPVFTDVVLEAFEVLKGELAEPLVHLSLPGGELDGLRYEVAGTPRLAPGDEVVVFLVRLPSGERTLLGFSQGSYRLFLDPVTGSTLAARSTAEALLVSPARPGASRQAMGVGVQDLEDWGVMRLRLLGHLGGGAP